MIQDDFELFLVIMVKNFLSRYERFRSVSLGKETEQ